MAPITARRGAPLRLLCPRDWPLAVKVMVLCAATWTVLAVVLTSMGYVQAERGLRAQAEYALASDGQLVATELDDWHTLHLKAVLSLAKMPAVQKTMADPASQPEPVVQAVNQALATAARTYEDTGSFGIIDLNGLFRFSSDETDFDNTTAGRRDFFQEALKRDAPFVSGVQGSADSTDLGRIYYSAPVDGPQGPVGVLRARATLRQVEQVMAEARNRVGEGATGVLLDEQGLVIASNVDPNWVLRPVVALRPELVDTLSQAKRFGGGGPPPPLDDQELAAVRGVQAPTTFTWHLNSAAYAAVAVPLHQTNWTYVAALPLATLEAPAQAFLRNALIAAVLGLFLTAGLALVCARPIVRMLAALTTAAKGLARGELDQDVGVPSRDELGQMAAAFREMVAYQQTMAGLADAVARGDLTPNVQPKSEADRLGIALRGMVGNLRRLVRRLEEMAFRDSLTDLPNRALFMERLAAGTTASEPVPPLAVLFIDLDNFKLINDTLGHAAGDQLLVAVAGRLRACVSASSDTVARLGGDEFTILLQDLSDPADATRVAERIAQALRQPVRVADRLVDITASIGIAVRDDGRRTPGELLQAADLALYAAKDAGRARWAVFDPSMAASAADRLARGEGHPLRHPRAA